MNTKINSDFFKINCYHAFYKHRHQKYIYTFINSFYLTKYQSKCKESNAKILIVPTFAFEKIDMKTSKALQLSKKTILYQLLRFIIEASLPMNYQKYIIQFHW